MILSIVLMLFLVDYKYDFQLDGFALSGPSEEQKISEIGYSKQLSVLGDQGQNIENIGICRRRKFIFRTCHNMFRSGSFPSLAKRDDREGHGNANRKGTHGGFASFPRNLVERDSLADGGIGYGDDQHRKPLSRMRQRPSKRCVYLCGKLLSI